MTRELNVRITLQERSEHFYTDNAFANIIRFALENAAYVISVDSVQVETVKPENQKK